MRVRSLGVILNGVRACSDDETTLPAEAETLRGTGHILFVSMCGALFKFACP